MNYSIILSLLYLMLLLVIINLISSKKNKNVKIIICFLLIISIAWINGSGLNLLNQTLYFLNKLI